MRVVLHVSVYIMHGDANWTITEIYDNVHRGHLLVIEIVLFDQVSGPRHARELLLRAVGEVNPSEISFTERAAIRTQCRKLANFMKVSYPCTSP